MSISDNIQIADNYFNDSIDLLFRYKLTFDHFSFVKSRRVKAFIDLRMSFECILKASVSYFAHINGERRCIIRKIEGYGHRVDKLAEVFSQYMSERHAVSVSEFVADLRQLPMGLRYKLDCFDFLEAKEDLYYRTVGSDTWLQNLYECTKSICDWLNEHLKRHSRIINGAELWEELVKPKHNKYLYNNRKR